jgi:multiple sugar transport system substrate-binding protein
MRPRWTQIGIVAIAASLSLAACSGGNQATTASATATPNSNPITVLIASSTPAEGDSVKAAVAGWSAQSGIKAQVKVASNLVQEASQGFASGKPDDVLYVSTDQLPGWAKNGSLMAYGDQLTNKADFYPGLAKAFTYDGKFYCAPKDFSTLALVINTDMWSKAGLTDADVPKTWADLEAVAKKLTQGKRVGLAMNAQIERIGVFFGQNGGSLTSDDGKTATANSAANVGGLAFVKKMLNEGWGAWASDLGSGWGGEALGKEQAAMVIEGNWITGAMSSTYPSVHYKVVELPSGQKASTLQYTNCWGIAADGQNKVAAVKLVEYLTSTDQQLAFAKAFGVMPSVQSAAEKWKSDNPNMVPFINGAAYAQNLPASAAAIQAIADFNSKLGELKSGDPQAMLDKLQTNLAAALNG